MARKQSLSDKDIVGTGNIKLPSGIVPDIEGIDYIGGSIGEDDGGNEEVVDTTPENQLEAPRDLKVEEVIYKFTPSGQEYAQVVISFEADPRATGSRQRITAL